MPHPPLILLVAIGLASGILSGLFGIGGGIVVVPALVYLVGFDQHLATGTSLAILLPPIGLAAVTEYYRHGQVHVYAAVVIALTIVMGGWIGAVLANHVLGSYLRAGFAVFVLLLGVFLLIDACETIG